MITVDFYLLRFCLSSIPLRYRNQTVAIKIVHKGETPEEIAKIEARFAREVAMLSRVQHKNLVKVSVLSRRSFVPFVFQYSQYYKRGGQGENRN